MVEENAAFFAGMTGMHRYDGVDDNRDNSMDWADNYTSTFANLPSLSYASSLFDVQDHNYAASLYSPGLQWTPTNDFDVGNYTEHPFTGTQGSGRAEVVVGKEMRQWDANIQSVAEEVENVTNALQKEFPDFVAKNLLV
ncbi:COP9 signalosome complex subunit 4 like protein [Verticillium longisporum]|nr:COP9 signalosome complex subunit 4 like protein [Verticillium longisporum]